MTDARFDVVVGSSKAVTGSAEVGRALDGMRGKFIAIAASIFAAQRALDFVWSNARRGAEMEETLQRVNRQMGQFGSNADVMVRALQQITRGQLSSAEAANIASRGLAAGLNPEQIRTFTGAAEQLSDVMGGDIVSAFEQVTTASQTGRGAVLANIGVYVDMEQEVKKLAFSTGRTTEEITKQERAMIAQRAITEQVINSTQRLNDELSDADRLVAIEKRWTDFWDSVSMGIKKALVATLDFNSAIQKTFRSLVIEPFTGPLFQGANEPIPLPNTNLPGRAGDGGSRSSALTGAQLEGDLTRALAVGDAAIARSRVALDRWFEHYQDLVNRGQIGELEALDLRISKQREFFDLQRTNLQSQLILEHQFHKDTLRTAVDSTEGKIAEEQRHKSEVQKIALERAQLEVEATASGQRAFEERAAAERAIVQREMATRAEMDDTLRSLNEQGRQRDLRDVEEYYQGKISMALAAFATDQEIARLERNLLEEQLALRLKISREEANHALSAGRLGNAAGVNDVLSRADPEMSRRAKEGLLGRSVAQDQELMERANGNFFAGWARGLQQYTRNTSSAFGLAQDMARRTAQTMEQGFERFFFAPMEDGWKGMLNGLLDMTKQIIAKMMAQMMTAAVLNPLMQFVGGGLGGVFGSFSALGTHGSVAGVNVRGLSFAGGGMGDFGTGTFARLHGPEAVVPLPDGRRIPVDLNLAHGSSTAGGSGTMPVTIINQHGGAEVEANERRNANTGNPELEILVTKAVNRSVQEGRFDKSFRNRFGLTPGER